MYCQDFQNQNLRALKALQAYEVSQKVWVILEGPRSYDNEAGNPRKSKSLVNWRAKETRKLGKLQSLGSQKA